jgi:hypothetical protein
MMMAIAVTTTRITTRARLLPSLAGRCLISSKSAEHIPALNSFHLGIWNARFEQLREFKVQLGHCLVPKKYAANPKLGRWVGTQRNNYKLYQEGNPSSMTEERIRELESVGFDWEVTNAYWDALLEQLREYKAEFGHCLVPKQYAANPALGNWVQKQRRNYKLYQEEKPSSMTEERVRELESVGFDWRTDNLTWTNRFKKLREYKAEFGHCLVPQQYAVNHKLGWWVVTQRYDYRLQQEGKPSPMTEKCIRELESIGFHWGTEYLPWTERLKQLREYKAEFGHCLVSIEYSVNPALGSWVQNQRLNYRLQQEGKPSSMTEERIRELESIGFDWRTNDFTWN